jgi:hypothetical protein
LNLLVAKKSIIWRLIEFDTSIYKWKKTERSAVPSEVLQKPKFYEGDYCTQYLLLGKFVFFCFFLLRLGVPQAILSPYYGEPEL